MLHFKSKHQHSKSQTQFIAPKNTSHLSESFSVKVFDPRCEYEVPKFQDLNQIDEEQSGQLGSCESAEEEEHFFNWFQVHHDFKVNRKLQQRVFKDSKIQNSKLSKKQHQSIIQEKQIPNFKDQMCKVLQSSQGRDKRQNTKREKENRIPLPQKKDKVSVKYEAPKPTQNSTKGTPNERQIRPSRNQLHRTQSYFIGQSHNFSKEQSFEQTMAASSKLLRDIQNQRQQSKMTKSTERKAPIAAMSTQKLRKDFISRNKDRVKLLSARSRQKKSTDFTQESVIKLQMGKLHEQFKVLHSKDTPSMHLRQKSTQR